MKKKTTRPYRSRSEGDTAVTPYAVSRPYDGNLMMSSAHVESLVSFFLPLPPLAYGKDRKMGEKEEHKQGPLRDEDIRIVYGTRNRETGRRERKIEGSNQIETEEGDRKGKEILTPKSNSG